MSAVVPRNLQNSPRYRIIEDYDKLLKRVIKVQKETKNVSSGFNHLYWKTETETKKHFFFWKKDVDIVFESVETAEKFIKEKFIKEQLEMLAEKIVILKEFKN
jgi:hypothetical protein